MSPEEAAGILRVDVDAPLPRVERAYRDRARTLHPDRLTGASEADIVAAAREFARLNEAHELLVRLAASRGSAAPATAAPDLPEIVVERPPSYGVVAGWSIVLVAAGVISFFGGAFPYSPLDLLLRFVPLCAAAVAFALTGRRVYYLAAWALTAVSAGITLVLATFGSLLALFLLLIPVLALFWLGKQRQSAPPA